MNAHDEKQLSEQYARVPRVASPAHLDDKILQAARNHTPEKTSRRDRRWMPVLATACLAGMVFYVATPLLDRQLVEQLSPIQHTKQRDDVLSDAAMEELPSTGLDAATTVADSVSAAPAVAAPAAAAPDTAAPSAKESVSASSPAPQPETVLLEEEVRHAPAGLSTDESGLLPQRAQTAAQEVMKKAEKKQITNAFAPDTTVSAESAEQSARAPMANRERMAIGDAELSGALTAEEISSRLEHIRALADKRLTEEAERLLTRLLDLCPECDIPTSLAALQQSRDADTESSDAEAD